VCVCGCLIRHVCHDDVADKSTVMQDPVPELLPSTENAPVRQDRLKDLLRVNPALHFSAIVPLTTPIISANVRCLAYGPILPRCFECSAVSLNQRWPYFTRDGTYLERERQQVGYFLAA
jgi:hypothetical protein